MRLALVFGIGLWVGISVTYAARIPLPEKTVSPLSGELGASEPIKYVPGEKLFSASLKPMTVELTILSHDEFLKRRPKFATGWAYIGTKNSRCRIFLSENSGNLTGSLLGANNYGLYPASADPNLAHILAHELLHCMVGEWHP